MVYGPTVFKKISIFLNFEQKTIGFYRTNNFEDEKEEEGNKNSLNINKDKENIENKVWIYAFQIFFVIILNIIAFFIGMSIKIKRKKRLNELEDDYYDYILEDIKVFKKKK